MISSSFKQAVSALSQKPDDLTAQSWVFRSMSLATFASLIACVICTAHQYIGDNINCITGFTKNEHRAIETYCFISSIYTMVNISQIGTPHYGIGSYRPERIVNQEEDVQMHTYYQWVPIFLAVQSAAFYFPRWVWKKLFDKKKFYAIIGNLDQIHVTNLLTKEADVRTGQISHAGPPQVFKSADYMYQSLNSHGPYAMKFLFCEILAFAVALGNLFVTDAFLGGNFWTYGSSAIAYISGDVTDMDNPLNQVFPKVTKCIWYKYGPTGNIQVHDSLCVLPLNIVNEKSFIFLWIFHIFTLVVVSAVLLLHLIYSVWPAARNTMVSQRIKGDEEKNSFWRVIEKCHYGDWFVIDQLSSQMVEMYFVSWIKYLEELIHK